MSLLLPPLITQGVIVGLVFGYLWWYKKSFMRLALALLLAGAAFMVRHQEQRGVVMPGATIYAGPHERYPVVTTIGVQDEVILEDKIDTWYKIKLSRAEPVRGWVAETFIVSRKE